jgi:hypothetical protein
VLIAWGLWEEQGFPRQGLGEEDRVELVIA